ncbi:MAG: hypothetical protein ABJC13_24450 [Acidobacteriota bacterium]
MRKLLLSEKETSEKLDKLLLIVGNEEVEIGRLGENLHIADFLMGSPDITNAAIELLDATESDKAANDRDILATGQFFSSESDHLADAYYAKIADRVRVAHEHRGSMAYHVVLSLADPRLSEAIERRKKHFRAVGLTEDKIKFHCIESKWPFEVLIGINQAIVAFPDPDGKNPHFFALRIRDESFVAKARKWYRSIVSHYAKDYPL